MNLTTLTSVSSSIQINESISREDSFPALYELCSSSGQKLIDDVFADLDKFKFKNEKLDHGSDRKIFRYSAKTTVLDIFLTFSFKELIGPRVLYINMKAKVNSQYLVEPKHSDDDKSIFAKLGEVIFLDRDISDSSNAEAKVVVGNFKALVEQFNDWYFELTSAHGSMLKLLKLDDELDDLGVKNTSGKYPFLALGGFFEAPAYSLDDGRGVEYESKVY